MDFLGNLLRSSSPGLLGSCLALLRTFLARLRIGFLLHTHVLDCLKRHLKQTHVHGSHPFLMEVLLILPLVRTHPEKVTCHISLGERNICWCHTGIVTQAVVPAGHLWDVGVEPLYALCKLMYANLLGLLEHVGKVVLFLLSHVVWKHSEKVEHDAVVE